MDGVAIEIYTPTVSMLNIELTAAQIAPMMKQAKTKASKLRTREVDISTTRYQSLAINREHKNAADRFYRSQENKSET